MSGYKGLVEIFTPDGKHLVSARASYDVRVNQRSGIKSWDGVLTQIEPAFTLKNEQYHLRLPSRQEGTILISNLLYSSRGPETARFVGSGPELGMSKTKEAS